MAVVASENYGKVRGKVQFPEDLQSPDGKGLFKEGKHQKPLESCFTILSEDY